MLENGYVWLLALGFLLAGGSLLLALSHFLKQLSRQYVRKAAGQFDYELPKLFVFVGADRLLTANVIAACVAVIDRKCVV